MVFVVCVACHEAEDVEERHLSDTEARAGDQSTEKDQISC